MVRRVGVFVLVVTFVALAGVLPAGAQSVDLVVTLTADQPLVTVDLDVPEPQVVRFEVVVANGGGDVAPGVVVDAALLGAPPVQLDVGDVAPGAQWRRVVEASLAPSSGAGGPVDSVATARTADGRTATSLPARVEVQVISSDVIEREAAAPAPAPAPTAPAAVPVTVATEVLGATYERGDDLALAASGLPTGVLLAIAAALVTLGGLLVRRTADQG